MPYTISETKETAMPAMVAPLPAENVDAWEAWVGELTGPRRAEFEDMNTRHGLTDHRAYLQPMPDGSYGVIVITEGPGSEGFMPNVMSSDHEFDQWFIGSVAEIHGMDGSGPMPPLAERKL
jgi:hypothetical protein